MVATTPDNSKLSGADFRPRAGLAGRERELGFLAEEAGRCEESRKGRVILLFGEAGVGKSALLDGFADHLQEGRKDRDRLVLRADCERAQQSPYFPVVKALVRFTTSEEPGAKHLRLRTLLKEAFGELVSTVPGLREAAGVAARAVEARDRDYLPAFTNYEGRTLLAFAKFLTRLSERRMLVLIVDDLQWADAETVGLLHYLTELLDHTNLLIVCSVRAEALAAADPDSVVVSFIDSALTTQAAAKLDVRRLNRSDFPAAIGFLVGKPSLSQGDLDLLYQETEGNPFFLRELLFLLLERGELVQKDGFLVPTQPLRPGDIPDSIRGTIRARVRRLSLPLRRTLDAASVVGLSFDSDLLASAIEQRQVEILEELRDLESVHSMVVRLNGNHRFYHIKIQETVYDELPANLRRLYHQAVAHALASRGGVDAEEGAADHFLRAGDTPKALQLFGKTAGELVKTENWRSARQVLDRLISLELTRKDSLSAGGLAAWYYLRGQAQYHTGRYREALADAEECLRRESSEGRQDIAAHHLAGQAAYFLGDKTACLREYEKSLTRAEAEGEWEPVFRAHISMAAACDLFGDYVGMEYHYARASDLAGERGDPRSRADILLKYGMIVMDEPAKVIPRVEEALRLYESIGDLRGVATAEHNLANEYFYLRDLDAAETHYRRALSTLDRAGGAEQCYPLNNLGIVFQVNGDLEESERVLNQALDCHLTEYHRLFILNNLANTRRLAGCAQDSVRILRGILAAVERDGDPVMPETTFYNLGMAHLVQGEFKESASWLERSFSQRTKSNAGLNRGKRWKALARAYSGLGDVVRSDFCTAKAAELLQSDVPDLWYYRDIDWEVADLAFYE
jgi:tetratricopeptide (TPR) repeat protein